MAKNMMILMGISALILIGTIFIPASDGVPIFFVAFPVHQQVPLSPLLSPISVENVKRVHRRAIDPQLTSEIKQQGQSEDEDDLETAAGTNLLRPLFVYRQQMAYRDRNNRKLAARRRAVPDYY